MAIVSGYEITEEQARDLDWHNGCGVDDEGQEGEHHFDLVLEPDGHVTVGCLGCGTILIEFYPAPYCPHGKDLRFDICDVCSPAEDE